MAINARRLNHAAYALPSGYEWLVERVRFLEAIQTDAPEALEDLAAMPFILFEDIAREHGVEGALAWFTQPESPNLAGDAIPLLLMPIKAWAHQWRIDTTWMREVAARTLTDWYERTLWEPGYTPSDDAKRHFSGLFHEHVPLLTEEELRFQPELPDYYPLSTARWHAEERIRRAFKNQLTLYLDRMDALASERGARPVRKGRSTAHYRWVVAHHIHGETYSAIAAAYAANSGGTRRKKDPAKAVSEDMVSRTVIRLTKALDLDDSAAS